MNFNELYSQSTIDCENEKIFVDFITENYDTKNDIDMEKKIFHTLRVTKNCKYLAEKLNINTDLCIDIGLLHDFARFEQKKLYGSFVDYLTKDHGDMAIEMLFEQNYIDIFKIPNNFKPAIYYAIKYHNKLKIDYDLIKNEVETGKIFDILKISKFDVNLNEIYTCCKIARDGDKIDLLNKIIVGDMNIRYTQNGFSPKCLNSLNDMKLVLIPDINTKLDRIFCFIGFVFDLYFAESFDLFNLDTFLNSLLINYKDILVNTDYDFLKLQIEKSKKDIISKYNLDIKNKKDIVK